MGRPATEKFAKGDLFSDPSQGGLSCTVKPGKVVVSAAASTSKDGEEVFSESRSLVFKSLKVRRLVDPVGESVVYAVFSQRLDKNEDSNNSRFKSALCAVHVDKFESAATTQETPGHAQLSKRSERVSPHPECKTWTVTVKCHLCEIVCVLKCRAKRAAGVKLYRTLTSGSRSFLGPRCLSW